MKKKIMKKALAGMLATTMVLGMSMAALAADATEGNGTGTGEFEGHVSKKVVAVTLPTAVTTTFAYKMDPEGLIPATEHAKYSEATFEEGANVYFQSSTNNYTKDSAKLKVINKGTADVDVTIKAEVADDTQVKMAADTTGFTADNKEAQLYLGLKVADKAAAAVKKTGATDGAQVVVGLKGNADNFEITFKDNAYGYTEKAGVPETAWNSFEFGLTGACNPYGDYSTSGLAASNVTVTWSYAEHPETGGAEMLPVNAVANAAPSIATTTYTLTAGTPVDITVNLGAGDLAATTVSKIMDPSGAFDYLSGGYATYDTSSKKITMKDTMVDACISANVPSVDVIFDDEDETSVTITFN